MHCTFCRRLFITPEIRKEHEATYHCQLPNCYKCAKVFPTENDLINHYISEHCDDAKSFNPIHVYISQNSDFIMEIVKENPITNEIAIEYRCRICDDFRTYKKFTLEHHLLNDHVNQTQNEKMCPFCQLKAKNLDRMTDHVIMQHLKNSGQFEAVSNGDSAVECSEKCLFCDKKFNRLGLLQRHVVSKHFKVGLNAIPMRCNICDLKMENLFYLQLHREIIHPNGELIEMELTTSGDLMS